jgi:predicted Na+-dependent transporter
VGVAERLLPIPQLAGFLFVITSMLAMGMSLTVPEIVEPLKRVRLVLAALLANFVLVPILAYAITLILPLEEPVRIGMLVLGTAAGAPFLPRLVQNARGNLAFGVGLMVLLEVVTVVFLPAVLPRLLPGSAVAAGDIARSLVALMMIPLLIGLLFRWRAPAFAGRWRLVMSKVSIVAIVVLVVVGLVVARDDIVHLIRTGGILAILMLMGGCAVIGYALGGRDPALRRVMVFGTTQRSLSATILVSAASFTGHESLSFVLVSVVLYLSILLPLSLATGARVAKMHSAATPAVKA